MKYMKQPFSRHWTSDNEETLESDETEELKPQLSQCSVSFYWTLNSEDNGRTLFTISPEASTAVVT